MRRPTRYTTPGRPPIGAVRQIEVVFAAVRSGARTAKEVQKIVNFSPNNVYPYLAQLVRMGRLKRVDVESGPRKRDRFSFVYAVTEKS